MASIPQESHSSHQSLDLSEPVTPAGTSGGPSRRAKEDHDKTLARLTDQHFSSKLYADPLIERNGVDPQFYPPGVALEMERTWLARIQASREAD